MACNGLFGAGKNGQIQPPNNDMHFKLERLKLVIQDQDIHQLFTHLKVLIGLAQVNGNHVWIL